MSFGHFRFQQKQIQWHFYIIIKKAKFLAHTLSLHLYLHSPMTLSLSLSLSFGPKTNSYTTNFSLSARQECFLSP